MKGLADKGEREEKRRNEGQEGLGDMNPLTHITITRFSAEKHHESPLLIRISDKRLLDARTVVYCPC